MKKRWIGYGIVFVMLAALALPAWAGDSIKNEDAKLRPDYTIVIDGQEMYFKRADGSPAYALVYEDTTYLPLRAIGEALHKNVNWNEKTKTITLGGTRTTATATGKAVDGKSKWVSVQVRPDFTIIMDGKECQFQTSAGKNIYPLLYNGSTYLPLRAIGQMMDKEISWNQQTKTVTMVSNGFTVTDADSFTEQSEPTQGSNAASGETDIGMAKAKQLALHHAGLTTAQVQFLRAETDWDDGRKQYDLEFCDGETEYEYELDALSGTICKSEMEHFAAHNHSTHHNGAHGLHHSYRTAVANGTDIGVEKAKQIALEHAGLAAADVQNLRAEADWEDGVKEYDVEFWVGRMEYEYEIRADGTILKAEKDYED